MKKLTMLLVVLIIAASFLVYGCTASGSIGKQQNVKTFSLTK
jgi:hypothetical protein